MTPADRDRLAAELFTERAAIREFDGGMSRERAEHWARLDVVEWMARLEKQKRA